ncbi:hypothetical protein ONZ45_g6794 [Pleurotus djamor]|nr:hypothetical protein ONZ45_g6794 [Pleurotus djamor]
MNMLNLDASFNITNTNTNTNPSINPDNTTTRDPPRASTPSDSIKSMDNIKLSQTNHQLDLLEKLKCEDAEFNALEDTYTRLRDMQNKLRTQEVGWNPMSAMKYLYEVVQLKAAAKQLYERSVTASEAAKKKKRTMARLRRRQREMKASTQEDSEWNIVFKAIRDSDDEGEEEEEEEEPTPSNQPQDTTEPGPSGLQTETPQSVEAS